MSEVYLKLYDRVCEIVGFVPGDEFIMPDDHMINDVGMDSLDAIELIMWAEETFDIDIPDIEAEQLLTVYQVAHYLEKRIGRV